MEHKADLSDNPFLKIDEPRKPNPVQEEAAVRAAELHRLCYSVLHEYPDGKKLWEFITELYLLQNHVDPTKDNSEKLSLWWDGFRSALLGLHNMGLMHIKKANGVV